MKSEELAAIRFAIATGINYSRFKCWEKTYAPEQDYLSALERFHYKVERATGESNPSTSELLNRLALAMQEYQEDDLLLLSCGKDSTALALGAAEAGVSLRCVSIVSNEDERTWLLNLCNKLNHTIEFVDQETITQEILTNGQSSVPEEELCLDQAILPVSIALKKAQPNRGTRILDGMGNDIFFGHIPAVYQLRSQKLGALVRPLIGNSFLSIYARSPSEAHGFATALKFFFRFPAEKEQLLFDQIYSNRNTYSIVNFRAFLRGSLIDKESYARKTALAARKIGCTAKYPWTHKAVAEWTFNLNAENKFDAKAGVNKILLRKLLSEKINYNWPKRGIDAGLAIDPVELSERMISDNVPIKIVERVTRNSLAKKALKIRALLELWLVAHHVGFDHLALAEIMRFRARGV